MLNPTFIYQTLAANRTIFNGPNFEPFALGLSTGVCAWAIGQPQNLALSGLATGVTGVGAVVPVTTRLTVPPTVSIIQSSLIGAGAAGPVSTNLAIVVTLGVSQAFSIYGQYSGLSPSVGAGVDVSKVVIANSLTLIGILQQSFSVLGFGPSLKMLSVGLGTGIANLLLSGTGIGTVIGTPTVPPVPTVGVTASVVL